MNRQKWILLTVVFVAVALVAGLLVRMRTSQKLGEPGVRYSKTEDPIRVGVELPERVPGYTSEPIPVEKIVTDMLPKDTSFGQRRYRAEADGFEVQVNVVLMGGDRTSLHKPQFCLRGGGWLIQKTENAVVPMKRPVSYDLPVKKLTVTPEKPMEVPLSGVYVYWFVADRQQTPEHWQRMWWMARDLLTTGVLERWAYITYFAVCPPGREAEAFARIQDLIAESAPEFLLHPSPVTATASR